MALWATAVIGFPAAAQAQTGASSADLNFWFNLLGLVGLLGLRGFWRSSDNDGYTDDPV
jgi:hypothetical protein